MDRNTKGQFIKGMTPWNKSQLIEKICEFCGKKFKVKPYRKETARFCSYYCMGKITGFKKGKPALNPFPKGHKINLGRKLTKEHIEKCKHIGETNCRAVLKNNQAIEIKIKLKNGVTIKNIMNEYNISHAAVYGIATNRTWKHLNV